MAVLVLQHRGLAVQPHDTIREALCVLGGELRQHPRDALVAAQHPPRGGHLAAAVARPGDVLREHREQRVLVAGLERGDEAPEEPLLGLRRRSEARPILAHALAGPMHRLTRRRLALRQRTGDLVVFATEDVAEQERGALLGRQSLEEHQECHREIRRQFRAVLG